MNYKEFKKQLSWKVKLSHFKDKIIEKLILWLIKLLKPENTHLLNEKYSIKKTGKTFKKVDYKGKWFTIQDKVIVNERSGQFDFVIGTITKKEALDPDFVRKHKEACLYYGIPAVITDDEDLKKAYEKSI